LDYNIQIDKNQKSDQKFTNISWQDQLINGINFCLPKENIILVQWMKPEDVLKVYDIEKEIFPMPWSKKSFLYRLEEQNYNVSIVGFLKKELVAYAVSYLVQGELHFSNLAVKKKYQRRKIGEILLWTSLQIGKEKNCHVVHLEVRKNNNSAIQLYQKFGFEIIGVRSNYYSEENEDALLMSKLL